MTRQRFHKPRAQVRFLPGAWSRRLATAYDELDGEAGTLDCARPRALRDHATDSSGVRPADSAHRAVPGPDSLLRTAEGQAEHARDMAPLRRRRGRLGRRRWRRRWRWRWRWG